MKQVVFILVFLIGVVSGVARPNFIFILADDLGYGDIGPFGQTKIRTPNLDKLASQGMRFTQHYAGNAVCAPSRCVLMTGKHPGHAWIRNNREVQPEGQPPLLADELTIAEALKSAGYTSAAIGKWGLGYPGSEGEPLKQGFDRFYGYNCQRHAHNHYPTYLWDNYRRVALNNPEFTAHQALPPNADSTDRAAYQRYLGKDYAPDLMLEQAVRFVEENKARPFFLYFASTIPHLALQAPPDAVKAYAGRWDDPPYIGTNNYLPHFTPRAAYAAMISRLDEHVGKLMSVVDNLTLTTNTIFVFTSDNGPLYGHLGGTDCEFFKSARDLRGRKGSLYEGGIRVPLIVRWIGQIKPGRVSDRVTGFEDWLPTFLELANIPTKPANIDGLSFAPTLLGRTQPARAFLYREFPAYGGQQSIRVGDWKMVRQNLNAKTKTKTELYNLKSDPTETREVAAKESAVLRRLTDLIRTQHVKSEMFPLPGVD